ncbi:MAG: T9SS type A sorting domain-containing protein [Bacteroidia bacterium]|nr:T9SS type A sorting domain-containing protein [Bacteroidia bacterium]
MRTGILSILIIISNLCISQTWDTVGSRLSFNNPNSPNINYFNAIDSVLYMIGGIDKIDSLNAFGVAKWNGKSWSTMPNCSTTMGGINNFIKFNNEIIAYGSFVFIDTINSPKIAIWDYQNWQAFPVPFINNFSGEIKSAVVYNDDLIVGGNFPENNRIAKFDGIGWTDVGGGVTVDAFGIECMAIFDNNLYVGGLFDQAGATPAFNIACWDGSIWHDLDTGLNSRVTDIISDTVNNCIYACGDFGYAGGGVHVNHLARWDGQQWHSVGYNELTYNNAIVALVLYRGKLYCGGGIFVVGNDTLGYMARWSGTNWESVGVINSSIECMTVFHDELYVGGYFTKAGADSAFGIARYYEPPDTACLYFAPVILTSKDTFYLSGGIAPVHFYNNNNRADSWSWDFGDSATDTVWQPTHSYTAQGNYTVSVTVTEAPCTKTANKNIVVLQGTNVNNEQRLTNADLRIYPNPANNSITIEITGAAAPFRESKGSEGSELRITDSHGKLVKAYQIKESNSKIEIITRGWAKGTYLCNLIQGGKTVKAEKLVIE